MQMHAKSPGGKHLNKKRMAGAKGLRLDQPARPEPSYAGKWFEEEVHGKLDPCPQRPKLGGWISFQQEEATEEF